MLRLRNFGRSRQAALSAACSRSTSARRQRPLPGDITVALPAAMPSRNACAATAGLRRGRGSSRRRSCRRRRRSAPAPAAAGGPASRAAGEQRALVAHGDGDDLGAPEFDHRAGVLGDLVDVGEGAAGERAELAEARLDEREAAGGEGCGERRPGAVEHHPGAAVGGPAGEPSRSRRRAGRAGDCR